MFYFGHIGCPIRTKYWYSFEWVSDCCLMPTQQIFSYICISWWEQVNFQWNDDEVRFDLVLDQDALLDFDSASLLKQQSANRHVAPLRHIILIPSRPVFVPFLLNAACLAENWATNTTFIVFGLTKLSLEPTIYSTRGEHANHYTTDTLLKTI
jgi:hypothetical protein